MNYTKLNQISKGWSSYIWLVKNQGGKKFALKEVREKSPRKDLFEREGKMLSLANSVGVGPKLIEANEKENNVVMEFVEGKKFFNWVMDESFERIPAEKIYFFIKELYRQCLALDKIGLSHNQLQVGKNILVREKEKSYFPVIIDFEKATLKEKGKTKNVGQIMSMIFYNPNGAIAEKIRKKMSLEL